MNTLILGIGNLLLSDEGVGVHIARALAQNLVLFYFGAGRPAPRWAAQSHAGFHSGEYPG
jgi:hypothetical protein